MKIEKIGKLKKYKKNSSFLPEVVSHIFAISKVDPNFKKHLELNNIDEQIKKLKKNISKQENLIQKSKDIKKTLNERLEIINNYINSEREELLEELGSEI